MLVALITGLVACGSDAPTRAEVPVGSRAPTTPTVPPRIAAIGSTSHLSPALQRAFDPADDFEPLPAPGPHDWLANHPEAPQTFAQFLDAHTRVPTAARNVIYLLPIGAFPADAPPLPALAQLVHAFYTLEVRVLPAVTLADVGATTRTNRHTGKRQLLAPDVLTWLTRRVPEDAFGLVAITMEDLYPQPGWNFVFGMASLRDRVGVQSFARQDPAFFGDPREPGWEQRALRRATWTLVHEIAHMFGLPHCTYWSCIVAGANNQAEADSRPLHACPVCLRKLHSSLAFDPASREAELARVLAELGIDDEAAWSARRAAWIHDGTRP